MDNDVWIIANNETGEWVSTIVLDGSETELTQVVGTDEARRAFKINGWFLAKTLSVVLMEFTGMDFSVYQYETHCSDEEDDDELPF